MKMTKAEIQAKYDADIALVKKYGDDKKTLLEKMVTLHYNLPEIIITAKSKSLKNTEIYQDLYQSGLEGMCRAMNTFDTKRGVPFFFHARFWVFKEVTDALSKMNMILDKTGGVRAYNVGDIEQHIDEELELSHSEEEYNERNISIEDEFIKSYIEDNKTEIKIISMYSIDGFSMSRISENENLSISKIRNVIKGKFDKNGNKISNPFIEDFECIIKNNSSCTTFKDFKDKYIKYT